MKIGVNDESELTEVCKIIHDRATSKVFLLEGNMGAGKTTLIKALCKELGSDDLVSSPTFALVNHYITKDSQDIFHFDFYRIKSEEEAIDIGFEEYLDRDAYCFIEWSERIINLLPETYHVVKIQQIDDQREIEFIK